MKCDRYIRNNIKKQLPKSNFFSYICRTFYVKFEISELKKVTQIHLHTYTHTHSIPHTVFFIHLKHFICHLVHCFVVFNIYLFEATYKCILLSFVNPFFCHKKKRSKLHCNIGYQNVTSQTGTELNRMNWKNKNKMMCIMQPALTYTIHGFKYLWKLNGKLHNITNSNEQTNNNNNKNSSWNEIACCNLRFMVIKTENIGFPATMKAHTLNAIKLLLLLLKKEKK